MSQSGAPVIGALAISSDKGYLSLVKTLRDSDSVGRALPLDMAANAIEELLRELAEADARCERMLDIEQNRLLLASEDEIRREILADGRDPAEYLKAVDKVMKLTGENALLKHDLQKALANHSADLSATLPSEPTQEMLEAGKQERFDCFSNPTLSVEGALRRIYKAMIDSAPLYVNDLSPKEKP